jgi:hypothetical protein
MPKINGLDWINIHNTNWRAAQAASENREYTLLKDRLRRVTLSWDTVAQGKSLYPNTGIVALCVMTRINSRMMKNLNLAEQFPIEVERWAVF